MEEFAGVTSEVTRPSYVMYQKAGRRQAKVLDQMISRGEAELRKSVSDEVFKRVTGGLLSSDFAAPWAKDYYRKHKKKTV